MKSRNLTALVVTTFAMFFSGASSAATPAPNKLEPKIAQSGFVTIKGRHFLLDGKPYYYAGANLWYGMYLGSPGNTGDRARLTRELDQLAAQGITNLRVLAISEASTLKRAVTPVVIQAPNQIDETLWQGLDFMLAEMAKRDMKAVLYLNNFWQWSGGMATYTSWSTGKVAADPDVTGDWNTYINTSASFYRDAKAQAAFEFAVRQLIGRRNSVTGRAYNQDPTIMSWQLANEPRPGVDGDSRYFDAFSKWIDGTAGFIKKLAPRQLVSTGNEGWMGTAGNRELFAQQLAERLPLARMRELEATYLVWVDLRAYGHEAPGQVALERGQVMVRDGRDFGPGGRGHVRVNIATSRDRVVELAARLGEAFDPTDEG